jgi:uncharacterized membrane protein YcaP (DUF421 family)
VQITRNRLAHNKFVLGNLQKKEEQCMPDWTNIVVRSLVALSTLFLLTRILGKKQISQLTFFEYVLGITLGDLAGVISTDIEGNFLNGLTALIVWFIVPFSLEMLALKNKKLRQWFEGKGTVVIREGKVLENNLKKERFSADELLEQLRSKSIFKVADVEFAMLEASGDLSVLLKKEHQPLTPAHLGIKVGPEKSPQAVIMDGKIEDEPLTQLGLNRGWLHTELDKLGVTEENVFIGQVDSYGQLYVDLYDDKLSVQAPQQHALLLATLKKCQADLELFALETQSKEAKEMYGRCAVEVQNILKKIEPILKTT